MKEINFYKKDLEKQYKEYLKQNQDKEDNYESRISFVAKSLFDENGVSEINKSSEDVQSDYIFDENDIYDLAYYDTKGFDGKIHNILLIKNLQLNSIEDFDYEKDFVPIAKNFISSIIDYYNSTKDDNYMNWSNIKNKSSENVIDKINQIVEEIGDEVKDDKDKVNFRKLNFNLVFILGNLSSYRNRFNIEIEKLKRFISNSSQLTIPRFLKYDIKIYFEDDILDSYLKLKKNTFCIKDGEIELDARENFLSYKSKNPLIDKSIIVNISAKSIRKLWKNFEKSLLGLNLRYYIKNKKIDEKMNESMKNNSSDFWIKNNGLVIICENVDIENKTMYLKNFSIINGGQTTHNIGNLEELDNESISDFYLVSKIIAIKGMNENPKDEIIDLANSIAEATNSQKPIKDDDLLVNIKEIKQAKKWLSELEKPIYLYTRKGEEDLSKQNTEKWQKIHFSKIIQIWASFYEIKPGTSRNAKNSLFKDKNSIINIFGKLIKEDCETWIDLLKFYYVINYISTKSYLRKLKEKNYENFIEIEKYINYCKFFSISLLCIIKIFLTFEESIEEYRQIIHNEDLSDNAMQMEIKKWTSKWWNKIENKKLFAVDNLQAIEDYWVDLIIEIFSGYFADVSANTSSTNFAKNNKSFYKVFMLKILRSFPANKEKYKKNIVIIGEVNA